MCIYYFDLKKTKKVMKKVKKKLTLSLTYMQVWIYPNLILIKKNNKFKFFE